MPNHDESIHEYFEELCALAAGGEIPGPELDELQAHLAQCERCRTAYADFAELMHDRLVLLAPQTNLSAKVSGLNLDDAGIRRRFLTRARREGLELAPEPAPSVARTRWMDWIVPPAPRRYAAATLLALLITVTGMLGYGWMHARQMQLAQLKEIDMLHGQLAQMRQSDRSAVSAMRASDSVAADASVALIAELTKARQENSMAEERLKAAQMELQLAAAQVEDLRVQLRQAEDSGNLLAGRLDDKDQLIVRVSAELRQARAANSRDAAAIAQRNARIEELLNSLNAQSQTLERERTLLAAGRDVHELMGARNLHIVDVHDVNSRGKAGRAFGRVFYTEEKSLIFYAFDLGDGRTARRNASFQAWGSRDTAQGPARSLGIFYADDQKQDRWVLKFDDPRILAEIDSVFVTVEPPGGSAKPTGDKFLYAYLKANPNHP